MESWAPGLVEPGTVRQTVLADDLVEIGPVRPAHHSQVRRLRHPWVDVQHPASTDDEHRFVEQLVVFASCSDQPCEHGFTRTEITALMNALRGGLDAIDLLRRVPGLVPGCLVAAYEDLEQQRAAAAAGWDAIVADPVPEVVLRNAPVAARLLPIVAQLAEDARREDPDLARRVRLARRQVARIGAIARRLEDWMNDPLPHVLEAHEVGRLLFDPEGPGLWSHEAFLPPRVGTLVPARLAALLGEQPARITAA